MFAGDPVPDTDPRSIFHFVTIAEYGISEEMSKHFSYSHRSIFTTLSEMTDIDNVMHPCHIGSDPAHIRIQIHVNLEIQIPIPDHFRFRLDALVEVHAVRAQSSCYYYHQYNFRNF